MTSHGKDNLQALEGELLSQHETLHLSSFSQFTAMWKRIKTSQSTSHFFNTHTRCKNSLLHVPQLIFTLKITAALENQGKQTRTISSGTIAEQGGADQEQRMLSCHTL